MSISEAHIVTVPVSTKGRRLQRSVATYVPFRLSQYTRPGLRRNCQRHNTASLRRECTLRLDAFHRKPKVRLRGGFALSATSSRDVQVLGGVRISQQDADILALLIPALGSVFLDPAMQVIDTGAVSTPVLTCCKTSSTWVLNSELDEMV